jgi:hypothetical protein
LNFHIGGFTAVDGDDDGLIDEVLHDLRTGFQPILPLLRRLIKEARDATTLKAITAANQDIPRKAHLRRIGGTKRWIRLADGLVDSKGEFPAGYEVRTTDEQHNGGQYVFGFPGGVFTIKREPHKDPEEGAYLQEQFDICVEQGAAAGGEANNQLKVFLSVPPSGAVMVFVESPRLTDVVKVKLDDLEPKAEIETHKASSTLRPRGVRSSLGDNQEQETE